MKSLTSLCIASINYSKILLLTAFFLSLLISVSEIATDETSNPAASEQRLLAANDEPENWMIYGRTYKEQRYSPLQQTNDANISKLKLEWFADIAQVSMVSHPHHLSSTEQ